VKRERGRRKEKRGNPRNSGSSGFPLATFRTTKARRGGGRGRKNE